MENRKFIKFLIPILTLGFFVFSAQSAFGYAVETHAFLTRTVVDFYNQHFSDKKISDDLAAYLIDGARLEDNMPRYMNHFYDPVNNRGLADGIYRGMASKEWSQDEKAQTALLYKIFPQTEASILSTTQIQKLQPTFSKTNFAWQKAIELYAKGETEQALFALGHALHLIEDASVPDHTRNDAHPPFDKGGSPYENWTERFNLNNPDGQLSNRLSDKKPIVLDELNSFFDGIATYSNNNFYSSDSIKNYELPQPDYINRSGIYTYGFKQDSEFGNYYLIAYKKAPAKYEWSASSKDLTLEDKGQDLVVRDYWDRLSVRAVQYSAGVVDLFFKEAEAARLKYLTEQAQRPFLATLTQGFASIFGGGESKDVGTLVDELRVGSGVSDIQETEKKNNETDAAPDVALTRQNSADAQNDNEGPVIQTEIVALQLQSNANTNDTNQNTSNANSTPEVSFCAFNTTQSPSRQGVIVNEVAWMGSANSANDEWLELKNISGGEIDITGWQLIDLGEQIKARLTGKMPPGGFYLLERTDDNSAPGAAADQTYTGALANTGEGLRLFDRNCNLIDEAMAAPDWPAGNNSYKWTMERAADLVWRNSSEAGGTPKAENSPGTTPVTYSGGGGSAPAPTAPTQTQQQAQEQTPPPPSAPAVKILISEIQAGTETNGAEDEFVELYNPNDAPVDLTGWSLKKKSGTGTESNLVSSSAFSGTIPAKGFFLLAHQNYKGAKPADLIYSANSNNLAYTNNSAVLYDASGSVIDEVNYAEIPKNQSLERKALIDGGCAASEFAGNGCDTDLAGDFELRAVPNPQNTQSLPEPRPAPAAVANFQISYSSTTSELSFNWDLTAGADNYHLQDKSTASTYTAITRDSSATTTVSEFGREYIFEIYAADAEGLYSSSTSGSIFVEAPPEPEPEPQPAAAGISNVIFSRDAGGNYIGFTLNDTFHGEWADAYHPWDQQTVHYVMVWLNSDPELVAISSNPNTGIATNWAGVCPSTGVVSGNGGTEEAGGAGFDNYIMPGFLTPSWVHVKPPVYDLSQPSYNYKVYFTETCPNSGFIDGRDLKGELTPEDFVTVGLWLYHTEFGTMNRTRSVNYPERIYFQP